MGKAFNAAMAAVRKKTPVPANAQQEWNDQNAAQEQRAQDQWERERAKYDYPDERAAREAKEKADKAAKSAKDIADRDTAFAEQQAESARRAEGISAYNESEILAKNGEGRTWSPVGNDQTNQGVAEQQWDISSEAYSAPGEAQQWSEQNRDAYDRRGVGEKTSRRVAGKLEQGADDNAGSQYWDKVAGRFNDGSRTDVEANLGGYYDRAFDRGAGQINRQLAARGQFGSTRGMQQIGDYGAALQADRANREAQYGLQRSADELAWTRGGADIAFRASDTERGYLTDAASQAQAAQAQQFDRLGQAHGQLLQDDAYGLQNRNSGMIAASSAQGARDNRIQQGAENQLTFAQILAGYGQRGVDSNLAQDQGQAELGLAEGTDEYNQAYAAEQARYQNILAAGQQAGAGAGYYVDWKKNQEKTG